MDTIFNITRFIDLIKREAIASWRQYAYMILGIVAYFIIALLVDKMWGVQMLRMLPAIYIIIIILSALFIDRNLNKENSMFYFTLPTSTFERFLTLWIKCVIVVPALMLGIALLLHSISSTLGVNTYSTPLDWTKSWHEIFILQSLFLAGYIYFRKHALIKTLVIITAFFILVTLLSKVIIFNFYPEIAQIKNSMDISLVFNYHGSYNVRDGESYKKIITRITPVYEAARYVLKAIFPLGIWVLSYFKMRETEI